MFLAYLQSFGFIQSTKISDLMDMPPVALISFSGKSPSELYYPKPLMQLWKECTKVNSAKASSSGHCIISNFVYYFNMLNANLKNFTVYYFLKAGQPSSSQESPPHEFPPQVIPDSFIF